MTPPFFVTGVGAGVSLLLEAFSGIGGDFPVVEREICGAPVIRNLLVVFTSAVASAVNVWVAAVVSSNMATFCWVT